MILAVTGGRATNPSVASLTRLDGLIDAAGEAEIRHGGAAGVDAEVALWLRHRTGRKVVAYPVTSGDWRRLGRRAGPARNLRMLTQPTRAHLLLAWPGGAGMADCVRQARELGIEVRFMEEDDDRD